jgi:hypothetical protein
MNGKGKSSNKKGNNDEGSSPPGKKKDLSKIKCFLCHKNGHYVSQCSEKKKGKGKTGKTTSTKTQVDDFATKFEKFYSLVSFLSTSTSMRSAWLLDIGASHHITKAHELFSILMERDSYLHVQLGDDSKYVVKGEGKITFHLELICSLDAHC